MPATENKSLGRLGMHFNFLISCFLFTYTIFSDDMNIVYRFIIVFDIERKSVTCHRYMEHYSF